ncbi:MAG: peptidase M14 [Deltaproteobacteria bacterium]|nr:peptidase M14 [Deltaproteobacteria bacterium]
MDVYQLIGDVPDYREFLTVQELSASSRDLARRYPKLVTLRTIGTSTEGRPIEMLTIGTGPKRALLLGTPHPNEPIGTLTLEFLTRRLCEDDDLRDELGYTFYVIKCSDPDGTLLNEGWFKEAFTPLTYALNFYRPPRREQIEWSFPVHYKSLHFQSPCPETKAVMEVVDQSRPTFLYSLHNAGFCGVYFYVSRPLPGLFPRLRRVAASQGLPIHQGEPEAPYVKRFDEGIFALFGVRETYDYLARNLSEDPAPFIEGGTSSDDHLKSVTAGYSLVSELPYYFDPVLQDRTPAGISRRDAMLQGVFRVDSIYHDIREYFAIVSRGAPRDRLYRSVDEYTKKTPKRLAALKREVEAPQYAREATRAEAFDSTVCRVFQHMLYLGEVYRLAVARGNEEVSRVVRRRLEEVCGQITSQSNLQTLPLQKLVAVQVGAGLHALAAWREASPGGSPVGY